tara:strand:- start:915 stop:1241 length:327 start_codon:yes stop_codon:yes gene_type:complete
MVNNYYLHSSLLRNGNEKLNNQQMRPSNKSLPKLNETQYIDHGRVGNKSVYHEEKQNQKHSYEDREPNTDHELIDGGSLQGWRDFKHGFSKGFGMVAKVAPTLLPLIL